MLLWAKATWIGGMEDPWGWERWVRLLQSLAWAACKGTGVELMTSLGLWAVLLSLTALLWLQQGRREEFLGI